MTRPFQIALLMTVVMCLTPGCGGPPQVTRANRRIVESLATAVSAQDRGWLTQNIKLIDEKRAQGQLSSSEDQAFQQIIQKAQSGEWKEAEQLAFALREAQQASFEDVSVPEKPKLREPRQYDNAPKLKLRGQSHSPSKSQTNP